LSDSCGGCLYCEFPYDARLPIATENGYETRKFKDINDVWQVIDLLKEEALKFNKQHQGKNFDIVESLIAQIPFFTCPNHFRDKKYLKLLNKYIYCLETGTPAHKGEYGEQPAKWVEYFFIIKNVLAKKEKLMTEKAKREAKQNGR
tara:strand:+ start:2022 stop:2459 length:438 start_codon:yes stop_codon:yes gene_type:complete